MTLSITQPDFTKSPVTVTVTSDKRKITLTATAAGETASAVAIWPLTFTDDSGHVWTKGTDNGLSVVYTY